MQLEIRVQFIQFQGRQIDTSGISADNKVLMHKWLIRQHRAVSVGLQSPSPRAQPRPYVQLSYAIGQKQRKRKMVGELALNSKHLEN